jgi:hypothetical protein
MTEFESESDTTLINLKNQLNKVSVTSHEVNPQAVSNITHTETETESDLVNDNTLIKNNIAPVVFEDNNKKNQFGNDFVSSPFNKNELDYQVKLLSVPNVKRSYLGEIESIGTDHMTYILMFMLIIVVVMVMFVLMSSIEKNSDSDDRVVIQMTLNEIGKRPELEAYNRMLGIY